MSHRAACIPRYGGSSVAGQAKMGMGRTGELQRNRAICRSRYDGPHSSRKRRITMRLYRLFLAAMVVIALTALTAGQALANGDIKKVKHIIIVMQENHSFDNYLGALAYAPGTPFHSSSTGCCKNEHNCVDGLICSVDAAGRLHCSD